MKRFKCHKIVEAAQIVAADIKSDGSGKVFVRASGGNVALFEAPPGFARSNAEADRPSEGDYLVVYDGGAYTSWSPKDVFEAGYSEIGDNAEAHTGGVVTAQAAPAEDVGAIVRVTVSEGRRAKVMLGHADYSVYQTMTGGQDMSFVVNGLNEISVREIEPHATVAHKHRAE